MGKQHFSANNRPSRGSGNRPNSDRPERGGYGNREGRPGNDRPERGGQRGEGYSAARPTFGQGGGRPQGTGRPGGYQGGERRSSAGGNERGGYQGGDRRGSYGNSGERPARGGYSTSEQRPARSNYGGGEEREYRPRRQEGDERSGYQGGGERPKKSVWQGQPVRYEGKPTVPRGTPGERNRKFIKQDPSAPAGESRPAYQGRNERRAWEERGSDRPVGGGNSGQGRRDQEENSSRPTTPREGGYKREGRFDGGQREERRDSREGNERGSYQSDERSGYQGGERRGNYGGRDERRESSYGQPRSTGERPSNAGAFRERRDAMRDAVRGGRTSGTSYGSREGVGQAPDYKNLKHYETDKNRGNKRRRDEEDFGTGEMRLNRYIANAGICSRREADALIAAGEIRVNGEVVTEMGYKVQPSDTVQYGKTNLNREKLVYVLLNKPKDFITTTDDPEGRKTVMDLVANASKERIFPVGRLDRNTTGLLLFTNDGEVAQKLSHPSHKNKKIYQVELNKPLTAEHLRAISEGVELEDGKAEVDDVAVVAGNPHFVGVELHIGRNRIVRRIFEHLGYEVEALDRVQYAGLTKKDLPRGKWRFLSEQEVIRLKYFI